MRRIALHDKAGLLVVEGIVMAYRYSESGKQLSLTNVDGGAIFKPLSDQAALDALDELHKL